MRAARIAPLHPPRTAQAETRRYGGLSATERRAGRRGRLLAAGLEYYGTVGFRHTTIPQLCSSAGVTARHFYEEFGTQEKLLRAVFDSISASMLASIREELLTPGRTWSDLVREGAKAYFREVTEDRRRARIFALEIGGVSVELDLHRRRVRDAFANIIVETTQRLVAQGGAADVDARMLAISVAGAAEALTIEWALARPRPPVERLVDQLSLIWIRTMQIDRLAAEAMP